MIQIPSFAKRLVAKAGVWLSKNGPTIMSVGGGAMAIGGAVMACKATLHADEVLQNHKSKIERIHEAKRISDQRVENDEVEYGDEIYSEKMMKHDKAVVYLETARDFAKMYGPAVSLGLGGIGLMHGAFSIMKGRHGKAVAALTTMEQAYNALLAQHGELGGVAAPAALPAADISDEEGVERVVVDADASYDPFFFIFDGRNPNWDNAKSGFIQNSSFVQSRIDLLNYRLSAKERDYIWVNDVLKELGIEQTALGHFHGWNVTAGDTIVYEVLPYIYGDDLVLHETTMDNIREMELSDVQTGYCLGIRLLSSSEGYSDLIQPRMIYNEVYGK